MSKHKKKIFISYSHKDERFMFRLKTHLRTSEQGIEIFTDGKVLAGQPLPKEIKKGMRDANIAIFLLSADFLDSEPCKAEWSYAEEKNIIRIPVVIKPCAWERFLKKNGNIKALPKDGKPVSSHDEEEEAYQEISEEVTKVMKEIDSCFSPKEDFQKELEDTEFLSQEHLKLQDIFVFPNLELEVDKEGSEWVSIETHADIIKHDPVFIHGEQSSGKTALARCLCLHLIEKELPVLYIDLQNKLHSKLPDIFEREYSHKFNGDYSLWKKQKSKTIILDNMSSNGKDMRIVLSALEHFDQVIVLLDSDTYQSYYRKEKRFAKFSTMEIRQLTHVKQEELIRKRVDKSDNESIDAMVDQIEKKVNMVIMEQRIVPRYPFFILTVMQTIEGLMPSTTKISSYATCYYVAILARLSKSGIDTEEGSINTCMNYVKHLAFARYRSESGSDPFSFEAFNQDYKRKFTIQESVIRRLMDARSGIIDTNGEFKVPYAYYYFLGDYLAKNIRGNQGLLEEICEKSFTTKNNLILTFFVHHCPDKNIIDDILIRTMCALEIFPVAKLTSEETKMFYEVVGKIKDNSGDRAEDVQVARQEDRKFRDAHEQSGVPDEIEEEGGIHDDIYRILKTNELVKQILHNHYGEMEKSRISEIVHVMIESGLRLVSLLLLNEEELRGLSGYIQERHPEANKSQVTQMLQWASFIWTMINIEKIVDAVSLPQIKQVIDDLISKESTPAYKLIGYFNHLDVSKNGVTDDIKRHLEGLLKEYEDDPFHEKVLSIRTQHYMRTHRSKAPREQAVCSLLGIPYKAHKQLT